MNKRKWLFVCVAALFATAAYSQLSFADSSDSSTTQTTESSTSTTSETQSSENATEETTDSTMSSTDSTDSTSESSSESSEKPQDVEDTQVIKQTIHIQKIISSSQIDNQGSHVAQQKGINGAKFVVYDITKILEEMSQEERPVEELESELKDRAKKLSYDQLEKVAEGETKTNGNQEGVIDFSIEVPANKKQAYYIVNESSPENISNSEDIILVTPVSDENGEFLTDVWLYPKSEKSEPKEEVKKVVSTGVKKNFFENCWDFLTQLFTND